MLPLSFQLIFLLFSAGLLTGTVDAIAGGDGLISLPILISIGLPAPLALGAKLVRPIFLTIVFFTILGMFYESYLSHLNFNFYLSKGKLIPIIIGLSFLIIILIRIKNEKIRYTRKQ